MPTGLVALLDDVAAITKLAAASLDDVGAAAAKAGTKAIGVVVDDAAVTPRYVHGFTPERELPIIGRIALGSIRNKILILLPVCLLLSSLAPWAVTPLLMLGGTYLCFEGAEKVIEALQHKHQAEEDMATEGEDAAAVEKRMVSGAIRTDFILSAEIMAIALGEVTSEPLVTRGIVLILVAFAITAGVYGLVGLIVKMDDIGLHLARGGTRIGKSVGGALVRGMPIVMHWLGIIGTAAMLWVGGGILLHGLEVLHVAAPAHFVHHLADMTAALPTGGILPWLVGAAASGVLGLVVGGAVALVVSRFHH
jgi:predicted DNA repair protein MutK